MSRLTREMFCLMEGRHVHQGHQEAKIWPRNPREGWDASKEMPPESTSRTAHPSTHACHTCHPHKPVALRTLMTDGMDDNAERESTPSFLRKFARRRSAAEC